MQFRLRALVERDDLDGGWIASCPDLPGCMSQGETEAQALRNLADAAGEVLAVRMQDQVADMVSDDVGGDTHEHDFELIAGQLAGQLGQSRLPLGPGKRHAKALCRLGWEIRNEGTHIVLTQPGHHAVVSIPNHKEVKRGLLAAQLKLAGITEDDYLAAYK